MTSTSPFTVYMHRDLVDDLDEGFSPMDGLAAISDLFVGLPLVHPLPARKRRRSAKRIRLFTGRFKWYPRLGFSYVQIGSELHVVELWFEENPESRPVDVTLPETEEPSASDYPQPPVTEPEADIFDAPAVAELPAADKELPAVNVHELLAKRRQIAVIWSVEDVQAVRPDLNDDQAWDVLQQSRRSYDSNVGLSWQFIRLVADKLYPQTHSN